ncbi:DNA polymerase delta subunit 3 [Chanos chanos]|uniref:DNA polymerase delta subunit 3 n=1 Tax=Chanos chanos TaxID=29144 RepID=A0A6J2W3X5_CHACN|nr:DNA polymerase delta subunit 3 [Chanos chanos]
MDDLYLDNIDEFVSDQNKIVTYKWLSLTLGVHVNTAKQMLYHYLEQKRKETSGTRLHATYLVSGKFVENGTMCHKVSVVREDKLEDVKSKMDVTISVHVYSIQKAELKDSGPLYSTDYDAVKENLKNCNKYTAIRCASAVPRSSSEMHRAQEMAQVTVAENAASKPELTNHVTSNPTAKQPKGIMGMFANKSTSKSQESSKEVKTEQKDDAFAVNTSKSKPSAMGKAMSNFFGKTSGKKVTSDQPDKPVKEEGGGAEGMSPSQCSTKSEPDTKDEPPKESPKAVTKEVKDVKNSKTKRLEQSDSEDERMESQKKKRRRIKKPHPDSSDEECEVVPESPPVPEVNTPSPDRPMKTESVSHLEESSECRKRKRRRVLKSHTFLDDEGCIVTEKRYESESYSESEDDSKASSQRVKDTTALQPTRRKREEEKKPTEKNQKKAPASTDKTTKQASIKGFFLKK